MPARLWPLKLAYDWGAVVVTVEHRFFGESQPLDNLSTENLAFHTSRQAIKDLARFTGWFQASEMGGKSGPWITIGGSYPGALTAWYRTLEPQATIAAHSASGVIHAITNFTAFDEQVGRSVGPQCAAALRATTAALEAGAASGRDVRAQFGAQALSWGDFWYFMADAAAETVQYGHHEVVCSALVPAHRNGSDLVDAFAGFVQSFVVGVMGDSAADYDTSAMASGAQTHNNGRSWWWQKCNEFGWFQVAPEHGSIRSSAVDYTYHMEVCRALFGKTTPPDVAGTNEYYGGLAINGTQIFLSNGGEDPWQWAGLPPVQKDERVSNLVSCDDCAHCVDLYTPTDADADALQTDRLTSQKLLESWAGLHTQQNPLPQVAVQ